MCGFSGFISSNINDDYDYNNILESMSNVINHRGPDDSNLWIDEKSGFGIAHCRLSILDLTDAGSQPMFSYSKRYIVAYNGEIYNHLQLRRKLNFNNWRGQSDTETLLEAIDEWGIDKALRLSNGMFAFALWDIKKKKLILSRDRIGEKPLYYGWQNNTFLFGSELKSILCHPSFKFETNYEVLDEFFRFGYISNYNSIYKGIQKIVPGSYLEVSTKDAKIISKNYWNLEEEFKLSLNTKNEFSEKDYLNQLDVLINNSVVSQKISDVPIGSFLSGGIDSSLITAVLQKNSLNKVKTFSIGFTENKYDEAKYAKTIANYLGTDHNEFYIDNDDYLNIIPNLSSIYDEPFADSSSIPTYLVSKHASNDVKVVLSGDAGDELFFGYNHYLRFLKNWSILSKVPNSLRNVILNTPMILKNSNNFISKIAAHLYHENPIAYYMFILDQSKNYKTFYSDTSYSNAFNGYNENFVKNHKAIFLMYYDIKTYLPDDILVKVDRAAMRNSLETRIPFLDPEIINFALTLPMDYKYRNGETKYILKKLLSDYIPDKYFYREKKGFQIPLRKIITGPLIDWADDLIMKFDIEIDDFFNSGNIKKIWEENKNSNFRLIWNIIMYQAWKEHSK